MSDCDSCRGLGFVKYDVPPGHPQFGELHPCDCAKPGFAERQRKRLERITGLTPVELAVRLDDVQPNGPRTAFCLERAREFVADPSGFLTFWGNYGTAKTMLLQAIVNELREARGWVTVYVTLQHLVDWIREGNKPGADQSAQDRYREVMRAQCIAIDECDKARMTEYAQELRTALWDDLYRKACALEAHAVFGMNDDPATLEEGAGWLYDRMRCTRFARVQDENGAWLPPIYCNDDPSMRNLVPPMVRGEGGKIVPWPGKMVSLAELPEPPGWQKRKDIR